MSELFGTGTRLQSNLDVGEQNGSIETVSGTDTLERDTAFTLISEVSVQRGSVPDADYAAEIEALTRRVLTRDPRIVSISSLSVDLDDSASGVSVSVTVATSDGETEALLIGI